jgi:PKD repeat protein
MMFLSFKPQKAWVAVLVLCLLTLASCKAPNDPVLPTNDAVFALNGTVDGQPFTIEAGENGYYMYTEFIHNPSDSLYRFVGRLEKTGCTRCGKSVEILLADAQTSLPAQPANIALALQNSSYSFANQKAYLAKQYALTFAAEGTGYTNPQYLWDFGGAKADDVTKANPSVIFPDSATRTVCLTITDKTTLCSKTICNTVKPFEADQGDSLVPNFYYTVGKTIIFNNTSTANSFFWEFGDGKTSVAYMPEYLYKSPGTYTVNLTTTANGINRTLSKNVNFKDPVVTCMANFSYKNPTVNTIPARQNSQIIVRYTDDNGEVYLSNANAQPTGTFFNLLGQAPYNNNEKGEKTRRLDIKFSCRVFSTTTAKFKNLEITNGHIGIAYP